MRNPEQKELDYLKPLAAALEKASAAYIQAVAATAFACGVPPDPSIVIGGEPHGWKWMRITGRLPSGEPVLSPLVSDVP